MGGCHKVVGRGFKMLNLGGLVIELKKVLALSSTSNENVINGIIEPITAKRGLMNKDESDYYDIDKSKASRIVNNIDSVPEPLRQEMAHIDTENDLIHNYTRSMKFLPGTESIFLDAMVEIINDDDSIPDDTKKKYLSLAHPDTIHEFLAHLVAYCMVAENKIKDKKPRKNKKAQELIQIEYSEDIDQDEQSLPYVTSVLEAYTDAEGKEIALDEIKSFPQYSENLSRQRKSYYAAESLRRGTRDIYGDKEESQFDILKDETYDGVIDVWEMDYKNGLTCLNSVMAQATKIRLDKCSLVEDTKWVGNGERKGVCHILVNDRRIKGWVKK